MHPRSKISHTISSNKSDRWHGINMGVRNRVRPTSAREIFESQNRKRNDEAWKYDQLVSSVDNMKKLQWQASVYASLAKRKSRELEYQKEKEEKEFKAKEEEERIRRQKAENEAREKEEEEKAAEKKFVRNITHPEIEILRKRLDDLKQQNEEEKKKMAEKLSYESWKQNNPDVRQMESDRLNRFIREAWIDQKQWKEDERKAMEEERRKSEKEEEERRKIEEEEELRQAEKMKKEQLEWKLKLEEQIHHLKNQEAEEESLRQSEMILEKERLHVLELFQKRERLKEERKRKDLELFWARQHHLKLKQKSIDVHSELIEDEKIVEDLLRGLKEDSQLKDEIEFEKDKGEWLLNVLAEQKNLEKLREKEYDLLFSEEAERMWLKRQAEWQREQRARDKLMDEVMQTLETQVADKLTATKRSLEMSQTQKKEIISAIEEEQGKMEEKDAHRRKEEEKRQNEIRTRKKPPDLQMERHLRRDEALRNVRVEEHHKEIARLEEEMRKLWQGSYVPPKFGRKRVLW